jgi:hypothetical protein
MPNWCECDLNVGYGENGSIDDLKDFFSKIKKEDEYYCLIESFLPTPQELKDTPSPTYIVNDDEVKKHNSEQYISPEKASELLEKYGALNWYDWNIKNWSVKWSDCKTIQKNDLEDYSWLFFEFETPWKPPFIAILSISKIYPMLVFRMNYYEQGMMIAGAFECKNGKILNNEEMKYYGNRGG